MAATGRSESASVYALSLRGRKVRLLKLLPGHENSQIRCELYVVNLDSKPEYTALSYAWGNPPAGCTVSVNRHEIKIRKNLWRFLRQARAAPQALFRYIWIDALCVDQSNAGERKHQVALMGEIFAAAERVIAWIGPAHDDSDSAIENVRLASPQWTARKSAAKKWSSPEASAIRAICMRRYWMRLWIFQELLLARRAVLMCGSRVIPISAFTTFLLAIKDCRVSQHAAEQHEFQSVRESPAMKIMEYVARPRAGPSPILDLMLATRELRCSDIRDRVFAVLSVDNGPLRTLSADYEKSIPRLVNDVLRDHHAFEAPKALDKINEQGRELAKVMEIVPEDVFVVRGSDLRWDSRTLTPQFEALEINTVADAEATKESSNYREDSIEGFMYDAEAGNAFYERGLHGISVTVTWAAYWQHDIVMELMLSQGIIDLPTCFLQAIKMDHYAVIVALLQIEKGSWRRHIDLPIWRSANALQWAVYENRLEIAELLIQAGANVNRRGSAAFHWDPNSDGVDFAHCPALHLAAIAGSVDCVNMLLKHGAAIESKSASPEWYTMYDAFETAMIYGHASVAQLLFDAKIRQNSCTAGEEWSGWSLRRLLKGALEEQRPAGVALLLEEIKERDVLFCVDDTVTLTEWLPRAVTLGNTEIVSSLLQHGADVNADARDRKGTTALVEAIILGSEPMLRLLIEHGADVNKSNITAGSEYAAGRRYTLFTPLDKAVDLIQTSMMRILLTAGARAESWHLAMVIRSGFRKGFDHESLTALKLLLKHGPEAGVDIQAKFISMATAADGRGLQNNGIFELFCDCLGIRQSDLAATSVNIRSDVSKNLWSDSSTLELPHPPDFRSGIVS
jgi:ankyrin repeat protein